LPRVVLYETLLVRPDGNLVRFLLIVVVVLGRLYILLDLFVVLVLMMCISVGLFLIIVLFIISKHLGGEYVNILVDHSRGMEKVDERFLMFIQSLREVV
jgi:hypothetical protein